MSTGSVAVVLAQQPYTFPGLTAIGKIFFILDIILFLTFTTAIAYRFVLSPRKIWSSFHRPKEALFFGSFWVTGALLLNCMQAYGVPASGPWLIKTLEVLFWLYAACVIIVAVSQYSTLFIGERVPLASIMPTWIFPIYPFLVIGPLAAVIIPQQPPQSAFNIFIGGVMFQGLGWCVSMLMYTVYLIRLMSSDLPPAPSRPGMFVSVGPAGYTSAALVALGMQAPNVIPQDFLDLANFDVGACLKVVGVFGGIFVWLLAFWFFALSAVANFSGVKQMSFTLNWWALIFPNAGLTLGAIQIGNALESPAIKALTSAMTIVIVVMWFFVAASHIIAVARKKILWEGKDEDVDD